PPPTAPLHPLSLHDALPILTRQNGHHYGLSGKGENGGQLLNNAHIVEVGGSSPSLPTNENALLEPVSRRAFGFSGALDGQIRGRSEEHTSELQSRENLVCRL